jgi:holin-like protein
MIRAFALLLLCQLAGEGVARGLGLPVPGPVIGLLLLFGALLAHAALRPSTPPVEETALGRTAAGLLGALGLLFVPAGVGVVQKLDLIGRQAGIIAAALVLSTLITLVVTVGVFRLVARRMAPDDGAPPDAR